MPLQGFSVLKKSSDDLLCLVCATYMSVDSSIIPCLRSMHSKTSVSLPPARRLSEKDTDMGQFSYVSGRHTCKCGIILRNSLQSAQAIEESVVNIITT